MLSHSPAITRYIQAFAFAAASVVAVFLLINISSAQEEPPPPPEFESICDDIFDNDDDGYMDCYDADCFYDPNCEAEQESICDDSFDNDSDGYADCDDNDCFEDPYCIEASPPESESVCYDDIDDDEDGYADCLDSDCATYPNCIEEPAIPPEEPSPDEPLLPSDGEPTTAEEMYCGDGACQNTETCVMPTETIGIVRAPNGSEDRLMCRLDCGYCAPICGNNVCETNAGEDIGNCSADCDKAPKRADEPVREVRMFCGDDACQKVRGETPTTCPIDCRKSLVFCGNGICEGLENVGNCAADCRLPTEETIGTSQISQKIDHIRSIQLEQPSFSDEQARSAVLQFSEIIERDERLKQRLMAEAEKDQTLTAFLLEPDGSDAMMQRFLKIAKIVRDEAKILRSALTANLLASRTIDRFLYTLPHKDELIQAARDGDLERVHELLPSASETPENRMQKLRTLETLLMEHYPSLTKSQQNSFWSLIFPGAGAQGATLPSRDPKVNFLLSASLRKQMEEAAIDPRQGIPTLEDDINSLMGKKNVLASIIGIVDVTHVEEQLNEAEEKIESPSAESLLNARGILAYIRSSANFAALEETYRGAASRMLTGADRVWNIFSWGGISPEARAANVLGDSLASDLASDDFEKQKQAMLTLFKEQKADIDLLFQSVTKEEKTAYDVQFESILLALQNARHAGDLERASVALASLADDVQNMKRQEHGVVTRIIYWIQDFIGLS